MILTGKMQSSEDTILKIRTDFVTNSSSSSFLIVGVGNEKYVNLVAEKLGFDPNSDWLEYGSWSKKDIVLLGYDSDVYWAGFNAESMLETMNLKEARIVVQNAFKSELGIDIPIEEIDLYFGEAGNG